MMVLLDILHSITRNTVLQPVTADFPLSVSKHFHETNATWLCGGETKVERGVLFSVVYLYYHGKKRKRSTIES